ncbi:MAG: lysophospholipase [Chloroflexi bacterium]|nr:lysophospholipase [Chloroflexota bacterium]
MSEQPPLLTAVDAPDADPVETLLFAQHGWADTNQAMIRFGREIASPGDLVIAPNLGYVRTWLRIEPLIQTVAYAVEEALAAHPRARIRAVGHSMGGLIWIELLTRRPEWLAKTDRLALIGCPVGGAELAGFLDPLGLTIGRDLRVDRRARAEAIAATIPTLTIVGDLLGRHDGTVSHDSARLVNARMVLTPSASHAALRNHRVVVQLVRAFFEQPDPPEIDHAAMIGYLRATPGLLPAESSLMMVSKVVLMLKDGTTVRTISPVPGLELVFVADREGRCQYAATVPWTAQAAYQQALGLIRAAYADALLAL